MYWQFKCVYLTFLNDSRGNKFYNSHKLIIFCIRVFVNFIIENLMNELIFFYSQQSDDDDDDDKIIVISLFIYFI